MGEVVKEKTLVLDENAAMLAHCHDSTFYHQKMMMMMMMYLLSSQMMSHVHIY